MADFAANGVEAVAQFHKGLVGKASSHTHSDKLIHFYQTLAMQNVHGNIALGFFPSNAQQQPADAVQLLTKAQASPVPVVLIVQIF